jgi:hypothetical protein
MPASFRLSPARRPRASTSPSPIRTSSSLRSGAATLPSTTAGRWAWSPPASSSTTATSTAFTTSTPTCPRPRQPFPAPITVPAGPASRARRRRRDRAPPESTMPRATDHQRDRAQEPECRPIVERGRHVVEATHRRLLRQGSVQLRRIEKHGRCRFDRVRYVDPEHDQRRSEQSRPRILERISGASRVRLDDLHPSVLRLRGDDRLGILGRTDEREHQLRVLGRHEWRHRLGQCTRPADSTASSQRRARRQRTSPPCRRHPR